MSAIARSGGVGQRTRTRTIRGRASPASDDADLYWFYHMLSGAISLSWARTGRIDKLSGGLCRSNDFDAIADHMVAVFTHGLEERA